MNHAHEHPGLHEPHPALPSDSPDSERAERKRLLNHIGEMQRDERKALVRNGEDATLTELRFIEKWLMSLRKEG
jgi:hypothetical protein